MDAEPVQRSLLSWMFTALGFPYVILLPLAGMLCFVLALVVILRGKGPMAAASLVLIVPMPFLIGVFAAMQGAAASYTIIAMSSVAPKPSELAEGISTALVAPMIGMLLMVPGYATALFGSFARSLSVSAGEGAPTK